MQDNKIGYVEEFHNSESEPYCNVLRRDCIIINTRLVTMKRSCSQKY